MDQQKEWGQWIKEARQGSQAAFHHLYDASYPIVFGECQKILHNPADAEDAAQESYLKIYKRLNTLKNPETFPGWCRTIAHNSSIDYITSHQRKAGKDDYKPPMSDDAHEGMDKVSLEDPDLLPEEQAEQKDQQEQLRRILQSAMDEIPAQRALCLALYEQGYSQKEIAGQLCLPVGTVKSNIYYAKQALRNKIKQIEKEQKIQIHGFTLVPVGNTVQIKLCSQSSSSFIQTELKSPSEQKQLWNQISRSVSTYKTAIFWKKLISVILSVIILAGGITFSISQARKTDFSEPNPSVKAGNRIPDTNRAERYFGKQAEKEIRKHIETNWQNPNFFQDISAVNFIWKNAKDLIVILQVSLNYSKRKSSLPITRKYHSHYYTYICYFSVVQKGKRFQYTDSYSQIDQSLTVYETQNAKYHVAGCATEQDAEHKASKDYDMEKMISQIFYYYSEHYSEQTKLKK